MVHPPSPSSTQYRYGMKTVFLSFAGAGPREAGRGGEWAQHLREAGFEVIDHSRHITYDLIMTDLRRSDATVALVSTAGETWAAIEQTSSAYGTDMFDGRRGTWAPRPTLLWFVDSSPDHRARLSPYLAEMLKSGDAVQLPDDFAAAVARAIEIIDATPHPAQPAE
jgi:hypothetical protein